MIVTTYFANLKKLPDNFVPISICGKAPNGYKGLQYKKLAPKYAFFQVWKQTHDNDYYIQCFNDQVLSNLDPREVVCELYGLAGCNNVALVCYEKPSGFCHRHLVANWLSRHGFLVEEFNPDE